MKKENYSKYELIKAVLESNLEEGVKEAIVNCLIGEQPYYYHYQPYWWDSNSNKIGVTPK